MLLCHLSCKAELLKLTIQTGRTVREFDLDNDGKTNPRKCCAHMYVRNHVIMMDSQSQIVTIQKEQTSFRAL